MSVRVDVADLEEALRAYGPTAHLCTVGDDLRPHLVAVTPTWDGARLTAPVGRTTLANAEARPAVVLLWSPPQRDDLSLIVDGEAAVEMPGEGDRAGRIWVRPTGAVRHQPAPPAAPVAPGTRR